jgi:hypothetical protein
MELDFSLTLSSISGSGNSQPGLVPGAAVTGSYVWNTQDFYLATSYSGYGRLITIYDDPYAVLTFTATHAGTSYTYSGRDIEPTIIAGGSGADSKFQLWGGGPWFCLGKTVYNYVGDSSLTSFFDEMATGLGNGGADVTIGDGGWINTVNGSLSTASLTTVPEPSVFSICVLGLSGLLARRQRCSFERSKN